MMEIPANHVRVEGLRQSVQPLDENQNPHNYHSHGPWLMGEVTLNPFFSLHVHFIDVEGLLAHFLP